MFSPVWNLHWAVLASPWEIQGLFLLQPCQCWDYKCVLLLCSDFFKRGFWGTDSGPHAFKAGTLPMSQSVSPTLVVFFKHKMQEVQIVACLFLWWFKQNWSCGDAIEWKELGYGNEMDYFLFLELNRTIILHVIKKIRHSLMQPSVASLSPCIWGWPWTSGPPVSPLFCKCWLSRPASPWAVHVVLRLNTDLGAE